HAVAHTTVSVADWVARSRSSLASDAPPHVTKVGNPDGPLAGEVVVFTGALVMPRRDAAELAARAGCDVADTVTKKTST
ncbi:MAG: transposase, partial [Planctomycetota bacterium]